MLLPLLLLLVNNHSTLTDSGENVHLKPAAVTVDRLYVYFSEQLFVFVFSVCVFCIIFQDGVNWLSFLNKYKLHGILCDDMGLGKTLQSICILAGDHYLRYWVQIALLLLLLFDSTGSAHWFTSCHLTRILYHSNDCHLYSNFTSVWIVKSFYNSIVKDEYKYIIHLSSFYAGVNQCQTLIYYYYHYY